MATQPSRTFMTYQEFEDLDRFGKITELLDGEYFVVSPIFRHQEIVGRLHLALGGFLARDPIGKILVAPFDIVLSKQQMRGRVIQPDIMFFTAPTLRRLERRGARLIGMPDLAVEVLSGDGRYDRGKKLQFYAEYRIPELWHVTPDRPRIEVYRTPAGGDFARVADLGAGDTLATPMLPGFELAVGPLYDGLLDIEDCPTS